MTTRILPRAEYARLAATTLAPVVAILPEATQVIVVEQDGELIGHLAVVPMWHAEGLWIAPAHRKRGRVFRRLAQGLGATARALGISTVIPGSDSADMDRILRGLGAQPFPARLFSLTVQECRPCHPL